MVKAKSKKVAPRVAEICERLWKRLVVRRKPAIECGDDFQSDGNYVKRGSDVTSTWNSKKGRYTICAKSIDWQKLSLGEDRSGIRRTLKIRKGKEIVFRAVQEGKIKVDKYSGDYEHHEGTDYIPAKKWKVKYGKIPLSLTK